MKFNDYKYERPNIDNIVKDAETLTKKIDGETNLEVVLECIKEAQKINDTFQTMATLCSIRNSINTADEFYETETAFFDENSPRVQAAYTKYAKALVESPIRKQLEEVYGAQWFALLELNLKSFDEIIMEDLVEEAKLSTEYSKLLASAKIEFDGKINNLSQMGVYANSPDREVRKAAALKTMEYMESVEDKLGEIYDKLVHVRHNMAVKMGYENFVEFGYIRLGRSDYNAKDVASYRKQVYESVVPIAQSIIKDQAKRIGISDIKSYDLAMFYNDGNPTPVGNKDELVDKALKMYSELSAETKEFFSFMIEHDLMDLETKPNKQGGGYCTFIPDYKCPFIFSNFNGTMGDVDVLTHEAGHAFEVYTASKLLPIADVYWPTLEACEIHSMSMEFFAHPWMELFFEGDKDKYRYKHLSEAITFIPYGVSVDEFQHFVYENPNATPKERTDKWREIEQKYTPWKDYDGMSYYERGCFWYRQGHIFSTPFYYIDYTLAQVCAFQFLLLDLENHENAWGKYLDLCKLGGSKSFTGLLTAVGLKNPFEAGSLNEIMPKVEAYNNKLKI